MLSEFPQNVKVLSGALLQDQWFIVMLFDKKQFYAYKVRCEKIMSVRIHFFNFTKINCSEEGLELFDVVLMSLKWLYMPKLMRVWTIKSKMMFS